MGVMVVTGASGGIGRAVAELALQRGWQVACLARSAAPLQEIVAKGDGLALPCDVSDRAAVEAAFARIVERFGRIDMLFNNAGVFPKGALPDEIDLDQWDQALGVNVTGVLLCARAAFAQMKAQQPQGGRIVNNGSIASQVPRPGAMIYTATKHAVSGITHQLALDGRAFNIAAGQLDVGNTGTELMAGVVNGALQADGSIRPEPVMQPEEVARAVLYMAEQAPGTSILQMTMLPFAMPFVGRG